VAAAGATVRGYLSVIPRQASTATPDVLADLIRSVDLRGA
jgi:hypothetical protein